MVHAAEVVTVASCSAEFAMRTRVCSRTFHDSTVELNDLLVVNLPESPFFPMPRNLRVVRLEGRSGGFIDGHGHGTSHLDSLQD